MKINIPIYDIENNNIITFLNIITLKYCLLRNFVSILFTKHFALLCSTVSSYLACYPHFVVVILMTNLA